MAWTASSRSASMWYSPIQWRAFSTKYWRTGSLSGPSKLSARPQGVL